MLVAVVLATVAGVGVAPAAVAEEAPSSISSGDQVRAALVLGVCLVAIAVPVTIAVLRSRRR